MEVEPFGPLGIEKWGSHFKETHDIATARSGWLSWTGPSPVTINTYRILSPNPCTLSQLRLWSYPTTFPSVMQPSSAANTYAQLTTPKYPARGTSAVQQPRRQEGRPRQPQVSRQAQGWREAREARGAGNSSTRLALRIEARSAGKPEAP